MTRYLLSLALLATACSKSSDPPPAQPASGAPIAFEVTGMTPGKDHGGKVEVKAYNFSDKRIASYTVAVRYTDKAGQPIKVGVGTPFESGNAWTSFMGPREICEPKSWCSLKIEMIEVPADAAKAEVALTKGRAVADDGVTMEKTDVWESKDGMDKWPTSLK